MPTATWFTGQTSAAAGGSGFGTAAYTTTNNSYASPTAGSLLCVFVFGITNNAGTLTGGSFTSSVGTGTNPTWAQHSSGWLSGTAAGSNYTPFVSMFSTTLGTCTNLRFICDATDSIYQWFVVYVEYTNFNAGTLFGRWGSDIGTGDNADNEVTTLDQNTGAAIGASSHVVGVLVADGAAGAVAPGTGFVERYEGPSGSGQTLGHVEDDQTSVDDTCEWGAVTPTTFEWITFCIEVNDGAAGVTGTSAQTLADFTSTASGWHTISGTSAQTLANATSAASGTETFTGTSAQTLANATSAAAGWHTISGTSGQTLAAFTSTASGTETITGTSAQTLAAFTSTAAGWHTISGTSGQTLADFTSTASGSASAADVSGSSAQTLAAFTSTASGTETFTGTSAQTLAAFTSTASGTESFVGTSGQTLANFTSTAAGGLTVSGTVASTLVSFTSTASGVHIINVTGTVAVTLEDFVGFAQETTVPVAGQTLYGKARSILTGTGGSRLRAKSTSSLQGGS